MSSRRKIEVDEFKALILLKKKKPYILVEGKDDIQFYENLVESIGKDYIVEPIGKYKDSSNCTAVIEFMYELANILDNDEKRKYFLGIIDGDARKYRDNIDKIDTNQLLYILKYYSWESYFINKEVVSKSIKNYLKTRSLLSENLVEYIYTEHIEKYLLYELWLCGLKRLRDSKNDDKCNKDNSINRLNKDSKFIEELKALEEELFLFATQKELTCNHQTLLEITKGKWALAFFIKKYLQVLKKLPNMCNDEKLKLVKTCDYCEKEAFKDCLYELRATYKEEHIMADIINFVDIPSLLPIKERLQQLK